MIFISIVAAAMAALTWLVGWWTVVPVALVAGYLRRDQRGSAGRVALAAAEAWGALLLLDVITGPLGTLSRVLGGVMGVPALALVAITLSFPALMAWSAATLGGARLRVRSAST